eukprot:5510362-Alexandrium_andersonii.AAC.1
MSASLVGSEMCIRDRARGPVSGTSSGAATPTGLRRMLDEEFDPAKEARDCLLYTSDAADDM